MLRRLAVLVAFPLVLSACATFDEVEGVPDSQRWSYFEGSPEALLDAARRVFTYSGYTIDAVREGARGTRTLRVTTTPPSMDFSEVHIEPVRVGAFRSRAQTIPRNRRLPRDLEDAIRAELR